MSKDSKYPADHPCLLFEFLLKMTRRREVVAYAIPAEDADRLADFFSQLGALDPGRTFLAFPSISGRYIHLNLNYLIGISRLDFVARAGDDIARFPEQPESPAGIHDWQSFSQAIDPPDAVFFIDGFRNPLLCDLDWDEIALAATLLEEEPASAILTLADDENLRTRFIPARNVILMDSIAYDEPDDASNGEGPD